MQIDFEQLVREHAGRIRQVARRYAHPAAVDDLVQEILVRLLPGQSPDDQLSLATGSFGS